MVRLPGLLVLAVVSLSLAGCGSDHTTGVSLPCVVAGKPSARVVTVEVAAGGCTDFTKVDARESAGSVRITAHGVEHHEQDCTSDLRFARASVTLTRPLASRRLVHAPVSPDWTNPVYLEDLRRFVDERP